MDFLEKKYGKSEAKLRYLDADIAIKTPGTFVTCAITKKQIPIIDLKYWNVDRQEAYADADAAMQAFEKYGLGND